MEAKFNPRDIRPTLRLFAMLVYVVVTIIASVGAINYGVDSAEHIYTVAGAMNAVFGIISTIIAYKKNINKQ